jgi:hypothetical protein
MSSRILSVLLCLRYALVLLFCLSRSVMLAKSVSPFSLFKVFSSTTVPKLDLMTAAAEAKLLSILDSTEAISGDETKLSSGQLNTISEAIRVLEQSKSSQRDPVTSPLIDGTWKLLYTSSPGTNSPIQRKVTSTKGVAVYQVVNLLATEGSFLPDKLPDISNTVCISDSSRLRITAIASTAKRPLIEPRQGNGRIFGLAPFGVSSSTPPRSPLERINFSFQEARLEIKGSKLTIPYPVPFKLLGDEAKGWIDNTYLSEKVRIARGNKGTMFVLRKVDPAFDPLARLASEPVEKLQSPAAETSIDKPARLMKTALTKVASRGSAVRGRGKKPRVIVIFPAQLGIEEDYEELSATILKAAGLNSYVTPLSRLDWPVGLIPSFFSKEYLEGKLTPRTLEFYFKKVDGAVSRALAENPEAEIVLLGHSIGGWVARAWLSEWASSDVKSRVKKLLTLGSPHNPPQAESAASRVDQTRGLLTYINEKYPGNFEKEVKYVSIIGAGVTGRLALAFNQITESLEALLAYFSYSVLSGDTTEQAGDGIKNVPMFSLFTNITCINVILILQVLFL